MERRDGRGRPGAPNSQQESLSPKRQKEKIANNSLLSSVQQKPPDKLSPAPKSEKKGEKISVHNPGRTVFDCAVPKVVPSPFHIRRMLKDGDVTEEQAQEAEREWRENLRTWDRQRLEKAIYSLGESRERSARQNRQEAVRDIEYELKTLREELRQRE
jgi:hypothetical protein